MPDTHPARTRAVPAPAATAQPTPPTPVNEWSFAAEIKSWWDSELARHPQWRLSRCQVEPQVANTRQRSDLLVIGDRPVMSGELRLPDHREASPWHPDSLLDAVNKATSHGCRWAFTSDSTVLLLMDTHRSGPPMTRIVQQVELLSFQRREQLDAPSFLSRAKQSWVDALRAIAPTVADLRPPPGMPADELFINSLRALLSAPVAAIRDAMHERRGADPAFEQRLIRWMVEEQGWTHVPERWEEEIRRAAQLTTYVFATRLMFYEALRRSQTALEPLNLDGTPARFIPKLLREYFVDARERSGDYLTIFAWDEASEFATLSEAASEGWRRIAEHLAVFDLTKIGYDLLGKMFERLIDPHERYEWGQHYTNPDVVDLMLSFALPQGGERVLDPAAGGGTFLVRAYMRKKASMPERTHAEILREVFGLEVSAFAATLATVNLAVRSLDFDQNYPQVAARSFFGVTPAEAFMSLPAPGAASLDGASRQQVKVELVDAVVCNPPYVRIHELGDERRREAEGCLALRSGGMRVPTRLPGAANYHVYFWLHASRFLRPDGRLVFITAGEWLDSDYGATLQKWLLDNFVIECCVETLAETWFSEARVGTVVLVARRCPNARERAANRVRFALLRKPLRALFSEGDSREHFTRVDALRERILTLDGIAGEGEDLDWSVVPQADLEALGTDSKGRYTGSPWRSRFLRAPKAAVALIGQPQFAAVEELAEVRLGAKTGYDKFFFVEQLPAAPRGTGSLLSPRRGVIRIKGLEGWTGEVAKKDLLPAVLNPHRLWTKEGRRFEIPRESGSYYLYPQAAGWRGDLREYISLAEVRGVHRRSLVASNGTGARWFQSGRSLVASRWALPYNSAYDYGAWDNRVGAVLNGRLVGVEPRDGVDAELLGAVLNSTIAQATRLIEGKATGTEGAFDVGPPAVRRMLVPDVRLMDGAPADAARAVLREIRAGGIMPPAPGRDASVHPLRHRLDLAVLEAVGFTRGEASALCSRLYESYGRWRAAVEDVEMSMRQHRRTMAATGQTRSVKPVDLAARKVWEEIGHKYRAFPVDLLTPADALKTVAAPRRMEMPAQDSFFEAGVVHGRNGKPVDFGSYDQVRYGAMLSEIGFEPPFQIPADPVRAGAIVDCYRSELEAFRTEARERAGAYVGRGTSILAVVEQAQRAWLRRMRAMGMQPPRVEAPIDPLAN